METLHAEEVWTETQDNLLEALKEVSQEDLDRTLGAEILHTSGDLSETPALDLLEDNTILTLPRGNQSLATGFAFA